MHGWARRGRAGGLLQAGAESRKVGVVFFGGRVAELALVVDADLHYLRRAGQVAEPFTREAHTAARVRLRR